MATQRNMMPAQGIAVSASSAALDIPVTPWRAISNRVNDLWVAQDAPHHSLIGQTRSGKSYMMRRGIMPLCRNDNVLLIDGKGTDPTWRGWGHVVNEFPNRAKRMYREFWADDSPKPKWFRLVPSMERAKAQQQVGDALTRVLREGNWVVFIDELRYVVDARDPGLSLRGPWEAMILRGGSQGVAVISGTQEPVWVPSSFYTQPSFIWISCIEDERAHKRIAEIGSSRALMPHLPHVEQHHWIYTDKLEKQRFWAKTKVGS